VELYARVRRAVVVDKMSERKAARQFGLGGLLNYYCRAVMNISTKRGAMRRVWLRGNICKRALIQAAAFNISLILRVALGAGTPRECFAALFF
jgi:hypothetical protein